ncbi:Ras association domain-containing protein 5 [Tupaia chinensis]|uniref:Ras association domain-containing protein 5 n=1 Tax=Tupaia chinensis TaxID=246437 RepID=L9JBS1_TUPCH|nr:Ras association domain-containing protein 5 [Tupaia chinensis]
MTEGRDEEAAAACFRTVSARLQRLFRRLPKSRSVSEKLQTLQRFRSEAQRARDCKFTCHPQCRSLIQLDCSRQGGSAQDRPSPESTLAPTFGQVIHSVHGSDLVCQIQRGQQLSQTWLLTLYGCEVPSEAHTGHSTLSHGVPPSAPPTAQRTGPQNGENVCKPVEPQRPPTLQEIKQKIDSYNTREKNCLGMRLSEDGTYTGFIKVHLKLRRPVTVPAGIRPQSIYDAIKDVNLAATTDKRTSFYLPLDAIKQLHISSTTTVSEVIQGLLKKFMVVDNPQKFALFKRIHKDGQAPAGLGRGDMGCSRALGVQLSMWHSGLSKSHSRNQAGREWRACEDSSAAHVLFQKLSVADCPLSLRLLAGPDTDVLSFVLKENETGEVEWDAFSIPELQNFLTILEKEEQDKIQQVQKKYDKFRQKLEEALRESQGQPG